MYSLVLRFPAKKKQKTTIESIACKLVGEPEHVDIVLEEEGTDNKRFYYTAYMNERFSMLMIPDHEMGSDQFDNMRVNISREEMGKCSNYLSTLVNNKVRYNYTDAMMIMPSVEGSLCPVKMSTVSSIFPDVDGSDPNNIKKVYCSQAAVLLIRECLQESCEGMIQDLNQLNSRFVSPHTLHMLASRYFKSITPKEFCTTN